MAKTTTAKGTKYELSSHNLRNAFAIALFGGAVWIAVIEFLDVLIWISVAGPLVIMTIYILYFLWSVHTIYLTEQFADSLYFLGFLMTIISLVSSLVPFATSLDALSADLVLSRFGIALLTTAYGLGGRVFFSNFTVNVDQLALEAQASLAVRTQAFATEVSLSVESVRVLRTSIEKEMEAVRDATEAHLKEVSEASREEIERAVEAAGEGTKKAVEQVLNALNAKLAPALDSVQDTLERFTRKVEGIEVPTNNWTRPLEQALEQVGTEAGKVGRALGRVRSAAERVEATWNSQSETVTRLSEQLKSLGDITTKLAGASEPLNRSVSAMELVSERLENSAGAASKIFDELSRSVDQARTLHDDLEVELREMRELRRSLEREVQDAGRAAVALNSAIVEGSDYLRRELTGSTPSESKSTSQAEGERTVVSGSE